MITPRINTTKRPLPDLILSAFNKNTDQLEPMEFARLTVSDPMSAHSLACKHALGVIRKCHFDFLAKLAEKVDAQIASATSPDQAKSIYKNSAARNSITRYNHMLHLTLEVEEAAKEFSLNKSDKDLLLLVMFAHDLGRYQEALGKLENLKLVAGAAPHALYSVKILEDSNCFAYLSDKERNAVLDAIRYHASREVPLEKNSLAWKLTYVLRDHDKYDILVTDKPLYVEQKGIIYGLANFFSKGLFPNNREEIVNDPAYLPLCNDLVAKSFADNDRRSPIIENFGTTPVSESETTTERISRLINSNIHPSDLADFCAQKALNIESIPRSQATYWLFQIALIFDIEQVRVIEAAINNGSIASRLELIRPRVSDEDYQRIVGTIRRYLDKRGISEKLNFEQT